jgi:hypothetical protein
MWMVAVGVVWTMGAVAQGPGSCGFHLDLLTADTSTHSQIADMPLGVGTFVPDVPGGPGNPYTAWAPLGSPVRIVLSVPGGTLGPVPFGAGSPVSILWSVGAAMVPMPLAPAVIGTCTGAPHVVGVLPVGGSIVDGAGITGPPPLIPTADPGFPTRFSVTVVYPAFPLPPVTFQALIATPVGLAISNPVVLMSGPNPFEVPLIGALVPSGVFPALDEGQALFVPTPAGFTFYGVPTFFCDVDTNGFVDFCPGAGTCGGADFFSDDTGAGCGPVSPMVRPRINANHYDIDLAVAPPVPAIAGLTVEMGPPGPFWPARTIVRWKNVMPFGSTPLSGANSSFVVELWADSRIAIARQGAVVGPIGIGPGDVGMGYGGPSPGFDTCGMVGGLGFAGLWGMPPFFSGLAAVIEQDAGPLHLALGTLAVVFTPTFPGSYMATTL